ncbi:hypothetical protein [Reinekea marinisedimentorum]|uniref:Uncharacterized protein n=1 Tax=Reinekea marinisedimentorum TaxID=230495 RepID=A0A4R3HUR0_9GAMM|nr:hypothetical protein [Reinekea marinisedimentorum]TCS35921.1 hypothetical protein BCF53_12810 [Reinekea marinisedimentorum]
MIRCAFCGQPAQQPLPQKKETEVRLKCDHCGRMFLVIIRKRWWGYQRKSHIL